MFCPHCGYLHLAHLENNLPVKDFHCENCNRIYELKSNMVVFLLLLTESLVMLIKP